MNQKKYKNPLLIILFLTTFYNTFAQWVPTTPVVVPANEFFEVNNKIYCSANGLYYSNDNGANWIRFSNISPTGLNGKPLYDIKIQNGIIYAHINLSLWKSNDNCKTWKNLLPEIFHKYSVHNYEILAITYNNTGKVLKFSSDTGKTWKDITYTIPFLFDNNSNNFISYYNGKFYLGNTKNGKIYNSKDIEFIWKECNIKDSIFNFFVSDNQLYAVSNKAINILSDSGDTWVKKIIPETPESITAKGDTLYAPTNYGTIYRSYNKGDTWVKLPEEKDLFWANNYKNVYINNKGNLFAPATFGLKISKDKGENWYPTNTQSFATSECWGVDTLKNRIIASFGDYEAGACISDDKGFTWANDYPIRSFYDIQVTEQSNLFMPI